MLITALFLFSIISDVSLESRATSNEYEVSAETEALLADFVSLHSVDSINNHSPYFGESKKTKDVKLFDDNPRCFGCH